MLLLYIEIARGITMNAMEDRIFTARKITPNTYVITGTGCDSYLLLGESAILIDSGMSKKTSRSFAGL